METINANWELHPSTAASEGNGGEKFSSGNRFDWREGTDWSSADASQVTGRRSDGLASIRVTKEPDREILSESFTRDANAALFRSKVLPAPAKRDSAYDGLAGGNPGREKPEKENFLSDFTVEFSDDPLKRVVYTLPVDQLTTTVAAEASVEGICGSPAFPAPLATNTPSAGKRLTTYEMVTNSALCILPVISSAPGHAGTSSGNLCSTSTSIPKRKTSLERCRKWTSPQETKGNFAEEFLDADQICQNNGRPETAVGLFNRISGPKGKNRFSSEIFQCLSFASPASTHSSTSSPQCEDAPSGGVHRGRLTALPKVEAASNTSCSCPNRTDSQSFASREALMAEGSDLLIFSSSVPPVRDHLSAGLTAQTRFLPPCSPAKDLLAQTTAFSDADGTDCTREKSVPLPLLAIPGTGACLRSKAQVCGEAADGELARFTLREGESLTTAAHGAVDAEASGKSLAKTLLRSGPTQGDNTPDDNAAAYSDTTVASNASRYRLHDAAGRLTVACPLRSQDADDHDKLGLNTVAALCESDVALNKGIGARTLNSDTRPPMTAFSAAQLTSANPRLKEVTKQENSTQVERLEGVARTLSEADSRVQELKSRRNTSEQEDRISAEPSIPALPALSATLTFGHLDQGINYAAENNAGSKGASTNADELRRDGGIRRATLRHREDTLSQRDNCSTSVHGSEGNSPNRCAAFGLRDYTTRVDSELPLILPPLADLVEAPQNQQLEPSPMLDLIRPHSQRFTSRGMEDYAGQASKQVFTSDQSAMLSLSLPRTPLCRHAHKLKERLLEHASSDTPCFPLSVASCTQSPAESLGMRYDTSFAMERGFEHEGQENALSEGSPAVRDTQQNDRDTATSTRTRAPRDAASHRCLLSPSRTTSFQQVPSVPVRDVSEENKKTLLEVFSWDRIPQEPAHSPETSIAVAVKARNNRQMGPHESRQEVNADYVYRKSGQPLCIPAGRRSSRTPSTASCTTKGTSSDQSKSAGPRDPRLVKQYSKSKRILGTPTAAGGAPRKPQWSDAEDAMLQKFFEVFHLKWAAISAHLTASFGVPRTGKECRERWCNHVNPAVKKGGWTPSEDAYILRRQREMGNRWAAIAKELPGRTENAVKNRFISLSNCRRSRRVGYCSYTAEGAHPGTSQDAGVATQECSSRKHGGEATNPETASVKNRNAVISPQITHAYRSNSFANTETKDPAGQGDYLNSQEGVAAILQGPPTSKYIAGGNNAAKSTADKGCGEEGTYAVHHAAPSRLLPARAGEVEEESIHGKAAAAADRKLIVSERSSRGSSPSLQIRMQQVRGSPPETSRGEEAPTGKKRTNTSPETPSYASAVRERLTECVSNLFNSNNRRQKHFSPEIDTPDAVGMLAAERIETRRGTEGQESVADIADAEGTNEKERHAQQFETGDFRTRAVPGVNCSEIQGRRKQRAMELPRLHETSRVPIVRSLADLQHPRLNSRRRTVRNTSTPKPSPQWLETPPGVLGTNIQTSPASALPDNIHQSSCGKSGGVCTCTSVSIRFRADASSEVEKHYYNIEPAANIAGCIPRNTVKQPTQHQTVRRQSPTTSGHHPLGEQKQLCIPSEFRVVNSPLQSPISSVPGHANLDTADAPQLGSARRGSPSLDLKSALLQEARHSEKLNTDYAARYLDEDTQKVDIQHCIRYPRVLTNSEKDEYVLEHEEVKAPKSLPASEPLFNANLSHFHSSGRAQRWRAVDDEQENLLQQLGFLQHLRPESPFRQTCSSLGPATNRTEAANEVGLQRSSKTFPSATRKETDSRRRDSIQHQTKDTPTLCKRRKKHHQRERKSPEQQRSDPALVTTDQEESPCGNVGDCHLSQPGGGVQTSRQDTRQESGGPQLVSKKQSHDYKEVSANEEELQQPFAALDVGSIMRNHAGVCLSHIDTRDIPGVQEGGGQLGAKEIAMEGSNSRSESIQPADMIAHSYLADRLQCAIPADAEDEQLGGQWAKQQSSGLLEYTRRPSSNLSFDPLQKKNLPESLEQDCAASASVNDLQGGTFRAKTIPEFDSPEAKVTPPADVVNLVSDQLTGIDPFLAGECTCDPRDRTGSSEGHVSELGLPGHSPVDVSNRAELLLESNGNLIAGLSLDECRTATAMDCIATGIPEVTPPSVSPCSVQEGVCFFSSQQTPPNARLGSLQHQTHQQPLAEISLPPRQAQETAEVTSRNFVWLGPSALPRGPRSSCGHDELLDASVAEASSATKEDDNPLTPNDLPGIEAGGELYAATSAEVQGIDLSMSDAPRVAPASASAGGNSPAGSRTPAYSTVTVLTRPDVEKRAAELSLRYADDGSDERATRAAPDEHATTSNRSIAVGIYPQAPVSLQQLHATEKAHTQLQYEYSPQMDHPFLLEQASPSIGANASYGAPSPYGGQLSSDIVQTMRQTEHTRGPSTSPTPNLLYEEESCTPSTVSRRDTGSSNHAGGGCTSDKFNICPYSDRGSASTAQAEEDVRGYIHKALQEEVQPSPLFKRVSGSFQQSGAQRTLPPTIPYQEPDWICGTRSSGSPDVSATHDELNREKLITAGCTTQSGASTPPPSLVPCLSSALINHDPHNPNIARRAGLPGAYGDGELGSADLPPNQHRIREQQRLRCHMEQQPSDDEVQKLLRDHHIPTSEPAGAALPDQLVFENQQVASQKLLGVEVDRPAATPKHFVFEDVAGDYAALPPLESASVLSAAARRLFLELPRVEPSQQMQACCYQLQAASGATANSPRSERMLAATSRRETFIALTLLQHELQFDIQSTSSPRTLTIPHATTESTRSSAYPAQ